ncbi:MAG TPA: hypothetical protein VGJ36_00455 [Gemmatimonadales bacterium]
MSRCVTAARAATLVAVLTLAVCGPAPAQAPPPTRGSNTYWMGLGVGAGSEDFAAQLNASYQFGANIVSLRAAATAGLFDDGFNDVALLYGRGTRSPASRFHAGAALGISVADGCRGGGVFSSCRDMPAVLGLPIELQAFWRPSRFFGLGLYGFGNLNHSQSFAGLTLALQLGRLR